MGIIRSPFLFSNPTRPDLAPLTIPALVDTGSVHLCLPESVAQALQLQQLELRDVRLADGRWIKAPYCGPVEVRFANRRCFTGAMVIGDEPLVGAIPMEDMDLIAIPGRHTVDVHPASPDIARSRA